MRSVFRTAAGASRTLGIAAAAAFIAGLAAGGWWLVADPFGGTAPTGPPKPVDAGRFAVPAPARADGRPAYLVITLALDGRDQAGASVIADRMPRVKDAVVEAILALSRDSWFDGTEFRPDRAETDLRLLINRNLGTPDAAEVRIADIQRLPPA